MAKIKSIPGYEGRYSISSDGFVISHRKNGDMIIRGSPDKIGYVVIALRAKSFKLATLVAKVFLGERPEGLQINHKDGNKLNNSVSNLEYVTASENCQHRNNNFLTPSQGLTHHSRKLSLKDVAYIRKNKGLVTSLSKKFSVNKSTIERIQNRKTWKHAP